MYTLVLVRHGLSEWNKANKFTGWTDVDLHPEGVVQAEKAGQLLKEGGYEFDLGYTSYLKRAIKTLEVIQQEMGTNIPVEKSWRLNERHYGALQGFNKAEMAEEQGAEQVHIWRRSFDTPPPALSEDDERHPKHDPLYKDLSPDQLPSTECLEDCLARVLPYWESNIVPDIKAGKKLIISAHGNSLRAIVKHLEGISDEEIPNLNIPTGVPRVYKLDEDLKVIEAFYLEAS